MKHQFLNRVSQCLILFTVLTFIIACARNPVTGKREIMLVSEAQEQQMGIQSDPSIIASFGLYDDEEMQAFINEKGKEMGAISHRPDLEYNFRVLDSPVVNAFAVPGGFVYFTRGILAHFSNEAEFAGVLGHEIGHITARHSASQMSKQQLYGGLFTIGLIVSEEFRQFGDAASQGLGALFLKFGRDDESQSDELGVDYSTQIGYDAHEMANFFAVLKNLQAAAGVNIPEWQSTHPDPANRFENVHALADKYQAGIDRSSLKVNRDEYLALIDGMVYGEDPRQGFVENNNFYHPDLKFQFPVPANWQLQNTPQAVQMAESNGEAIMIMRLSSAETLQAAASAAVEEFQFTVVENANVNVNGNNAIAMISDIVQQAQGQTTQTQAAPSLRVLSYFIQYNGLIYQLHGVAEVANFNKHYNTFANTMTNFRSLHDANKINRVPERIKITTVNSPMTMSQALQRANTPSDEYEALSILNHIALDAQLPAGTKIKTLTTAVPSTILGK
jgi:predicted Zn-dependent protease